MMEQELSMEIEFIFPDWRYNVQMIRRLDDREY
jgi:hypothetical protein